MSGIPIQNLYYLLLYAWDKVPEGSIIDVGSADRTDILDLLGRIFEGSLRHVIRRGLYQSYSPKVAELSGLRGRLLVAPTTSRMLGPQGRTICEFDELSEDNVLNRILRATLMGLCSTVDLDPKLRSRLKRLESRFSAVSKIQLTRSSFQQVQIQGSNGFYGFLLNLCRLINDSILMSEETGPARFPEFVRDRLPDIYERFVFSFYKRERPDLSVRRDDIDWNAKELEPGSLRYLPPAATQLPPPVAT